MKISKKPAVVFATLLILLSGFPAYAMDTRALPEKTTSLDESPAFCAKIEYSSQGYIVKGTFTDYIPDTSLVQPLYSLDGKKYQDCGEIWDLRLFDTEDEETLANPQNQIRLFSNCEPLKSYLAEELDCFCLKLRITRENGTTYETQPAVIDRGKPQPIPEELTPGARFSPAMSVQELRPFSYYGRYQLTVNENATAEEISACLPDTLPVRVDFQEEQNHYTDGVVNCPVKWKSFSLPQLTAGESVTIADAAEKIVVPEGTLVTTPMGIFQLDEPLDMDQYAPADEVRLVLNVISEGENPTGILSEENAGLEMAFDLKPTGATAIRAYTFLEGDSEWTEIPDLPLLEAANAQPSTKNSDYTLVLHKTREPYRSYLDAQTAGDSPTPFFVGLKIEGGVYDGKQLILAWPDTYDLPIDLPDIGGSGGNHNNAGTGNQGDSTENGQRPNLPHTPENKPQTTTVPDDIKNDTDSGSKNDLTASEQHPDLVPNQGNKPETTTKPHNTTKPENTAEPNNTAEPDNTENHTDSGNKNDNTVTGRHLKIPDNTSGYKIPFIQSDEASDALVSSNKEKPIDRWERSDDTTENKNQEPFPPVGVITVASLCIAGICFAIASGKSHILRRFLPHK